jgi:hypothetical protein
MLVSQVRLLLTHINEGTGKLWCLEASYVVKVDSSYGLIMMFKRLCKLNSTKGYLAMLQVLKVCSKCMYEIHHCITFACLSS